MTVASTAQSFDRERDSWLNLWIMQDEEILSIETADDVDRWLDLHAGSHHLAAGVIHVTSVWRRDENCHLTLRLGPETPTSHHDAFMLALCRARADAIVTSGAILRAEPDVDQRLNGPGRIGFALTQWRRQRGKTLSPKILLMTRKGDIDFAHPFFQQPGRIVVYTSREAAWSLESRAADAGVEIEATDEPTPGGAIRFLERAFGAASVVIETGPSIARQLYEPLLVNELWLSTYTGATVATSARGGRQPPSETLRQLFDAAAPPLRIKSDQGPWSFTRFLQRSRS